ncbi:hypothetical protein RYX36_004667 [Vicia faba]
MYKLRKDYSTGKSLTTTTTHTRGWSQQSFGSHMFITEKFFNKSIQTKLNEIIQLAEVVYIAGNFFQYISFNH